MSTKGIGDKDDGKVRCPNFSDRRYHDEVWGQPVTDTVHLFEMLSLCSQQAGLSWKVVWSKRDAYSKAFHNWDMRRVASMGDEEVDALLASPNSGILKSRKKLLAIVHNAKIACKIEDTEGFSSFIWQFVEGQPVVNDVAFSSRAEHEKAEGPCGTFGVTSCYSAKMEQRMKKELGFKFLGSITLQAFLLQNGLLNGHHPSCFCNPLSQTANPRKRTLPQQGLRGWQKRKRFRAC